jgi:signal transduction histidine kinase/CheY-like chemotaxis protein
MMDLQKEYDALKRILLRERKVRKEAEQAIEMKSLQLYEINQELKSLNRNLEQRIEMRTRELEEANQKLQRANEAKSIFLSNMSHEIRTPLNGIIGITDLMRHDKQSEENEEMLNSIKYSADHLLKVVNEILDFSKIEAGKVSYEKIDFNLFQLLTEIVRNFEINANKKGIEVLYEKDELVPAFVKGDATKLNQVISNLMGNALKFTHQGHIKLEVKCKKEQPEHHQLEFIISDTGIGISKENLNKVFDSFIQSDNKIAHKYGGTGLGLSISKKLIEQQGGNIFVESTYGKGTSFCFMLPFLKSRLKQNPNEKKMEYKPLHMHGLLVEDNKINQFVAIQLLKKWSIQVDVANNGKEALHLLKSENYDFILMDLQMPVLGGIETTKIIRDPHSQVLNHQVPIIALTANVFSEIKTEVFASGFNEFISKPLVAEDLYRVLKKHKHE